MYPPQMRLNIVLGIFVAICLVFVQCNNEPDQEDNIHAANKALVKSACEKSKLQVACPKGQVINIVQASYGRKNMAKCNPNKNKKFNNKCRSSKSLTIMRQRCQQKRSCTVDATNAVFGDPCPKTIKYLEIQYRCVAEKVTTKITNIKKTTPKAKTPKMVATTTIPPNKVTPQKVTTAKYKETTIKLTTERPTTKICTFEDTTLREASTKDFTITSETTTFNPTTKMSPTPAATTTQEPTPPVPSTTKEIPILSTPKPRVTAPETSCSEEDLDCIIDDLGKKPDWFVCEKDMGSYPHPTSKKLFIFCLNWKPSVKKCARGRVFSEDLMTCVNP